MALYNKIGDPPAYQSKDLADYNYRMQKYQDSLGLYKGNLSRYFGKWKSPGSISIKRDANTDEFISGIGKKIIQDFNTVYESGKLDKNADRINRSGDLTNVVGRVAFVPFPKTSSTLIDRSEKEINPVGMIYNRAQFNVPMFARPRQKVLEPIKETLLKEIIPTEKTTLQKLLIRPIKEISSRERTGLLDIDSTFQQQWGNIRQPGMSNLIKRRHTLANNTFREGLYWTRGRGNVGNEELRKYNYLYNKSK